ncbi:MAG: hypothetical protein JWN72_2408 [Thermoleophilia bacterium]|nr:hypothetical protein [Thermoleophilia bacterium]
MPRRACIPLIFLVLVACMAAGCAARQSRDQYQDRLTQAVEVRTTVSDALAAHQLADQAAYEQASQRVTRAIDDLDADPPPSDLADAHSSMLDGLDGLQALLGRLGRCEALSKASDQDARACRQSISQDVYDEIRNDFTEADTIYRQEGLSLPGLGDEGGDTGTVDRGDVLDEPAGSTEG